ncbi:MAG TPA: 4-alpha-glucanotransferase [Polyangiaceae bacterium]|nr:4-alpha-glucanotransferase [Polyangiaceae bacterium]
MRRQAGVVLPLFAIRTRRDWGIGQLTDLPAYAEWIASAGQRLLQVLPPHTLSVGETSPYGALTAFGLDPIYADIEAIEDMDAGAIDVLLDEADHEGKHAGRRALEQARASVRVDYVGVRALKTRALDAAFTRFHEREWVRDTPRARRLADFIREEGGWLDDLAQYESLRASYGGWGWASWADDDRDRAPVAMARSRRERARDLLRVAYVQWTLYGQWDAAHARMRELGVELMGDVPFVVGTESADVWSHASQFNLHLSLGAPPDDFSVDGQDWGLPSYDWLAMESDDLAWLRMRARHAGRMYDRFRLDHVVGYFRQWVRRKDGKDRGRFDPEGPESQRARGARVLRAVLKEVSGKGVLVDAPRAIAEDLGVIPPFVRESLAELGMPGYRVLPWEKDAGTLRDPLSFPASSVASWSTHDTAPIDAWWPELPPNERAQFARRAGFAGQKSEGASEGANEGKIVGIAEGVEDDPARSVALLGDMYRAKSDLALALAQELIGAKDRINTPATVGPENWSWRLPRPLEDLRVDPQLTARFAAIRELARKSGR